MSSFRKRAPGKATEHPDYIISLSGGIDSVAATLLVHDAIKTSQSGGNFGKRPIGMYFDTRVGVPLNRLYVEQLTDHIGLQLWTLRTDENFKQWIQQDGAPGSARHGMVRNMLKGRQSTKVISAFDNPTIILGISADESPARAAFSKVEHKRRHTEIYPCHRLSRVDRARIILEHEDCPINPLWLHPGAISDCGCLANGDPSELVETEELFPEFGQRLREWEESINHDGLKANLGWDGLTKSERTAVENGYEQMSLCSSGCGRKREPAVVKAFQARAEGKSADEAIAILDEEANKSTTKPIFES